MTPSQLLDQRITELNDWRGEQIAKLSTIISAADPQLQLEWKWGSPVWTCKGLICSLGSFKDHIKVHFFQGANLADPDKLFNAGLEAKVTRGIDLHESESIDIAKLTKLLQSAVAYNQSKK